MKKNKKLVTIGGGTGSFMLLSGLKQYSYDLTAIVTMADDGGSTGKLRDELGVLPPGDIRQCLVALSESSMQLRNLMTYRFEKGDLKGHNFGNLFLSALEKINGNFTDGLAEAMHILNVHGHIVPVSEDDMRLKIRLSDGRILIGEKELDDNEDIRTTGIYDVQLAKKVRVHQQAVHAVQKAQFIIIGPGDHFGSIMPNLLVSGLAKAIEKSSAKVVFVVPLTNKKGLTDQYDVHRYVCDIEKLIGKNRIDFVIYNTKKPDKKLIRQYEKREGKNSLVELNVRQKNKYKIISGDLLRKEHVSRTVNDELAHTRAFIRHDSDKLAQAISFITTYQQFHSFHIT